MNDKQINFNWRIFFWALALSLLIGASTPVAILIAGFVEIVVSIIADAVKGKDTQP